MEGVRPAGTHGNRRAEARTPNHLTGCDWWVRLVGAIGGCDWWVRGGSVGGGRIGERNWGGSDFGIGLIFGLVEFGGEHGDEARNFDKGILCFF